MLKLFSCLFPVFLGVFLGVFIGISSETQAETQAEECRSVPAVTMPVSVDGKLDETAWQQALRVEGDGFVYWLARDGERLTVAVQSRRADGENPTVRVIARENGRNTPAFIDDCAEVKVRGISTFFNARNALWQEPSEHPVLWESASRVGEDGTWTLEAAASCRALGIEVPKDGGNAAAPVSAQISVPISVVRHWFRKGEDSFSVAFDFEFFPSVSLMRMKADISAFSDREKVTGAAVRLVEAESKNVLAETEAKEFQNYRTEISHWEIPELPEGKYELELLLHGVKHARIASPFVRYRFEWEGNRIGMSDRLIPPFTAIEITEDSASGLTTVGTLLRTHTLDGLGLWRQVTIQDSKGRKKELLTAPSRLEIAADGSRPEVIHGNGIRWTKRTPTRAEGTASWSADAGNSEDPIRGTVQILWDFDGLMQWNLTLEPTSRQVDFLRLTVPMADRLAPLMHACTDGVRFNYAGYVPAGDGTVWKSSDAPRRQIVGNFVPYLWVGAEEPGISFCAENDAGWINDSERPCQELIREGETLSLVFHLIHRPSRIDFARTVNLGFQATPIKPMPKNWRRKTFGAWQTASFVPPEDYLNFWGACYYWGAETPCRDYYPRGGDMTYLRKIAQVRNGGEKDAEFIENWKNGYTQALAAIPEPDGRAALDKTYRAHVNAGFNVRQHAPICAYTNGRGVRFDTPEGQTFLNEWDVTPFAPRIWPYGGGVDYELDPVASFRDYALWYFRKMSEITVDTIYWDDFFFVSNFNTFQTAAFPIADPETGAEDGRIQPSMGLYNMREYVRRTAVMFLEMGRNPNNIIHDTNTAINPVLSMAQMNYTWEDKPGDADFQDRFSRDYIRAESIGRQQGNIPFNLWLVNSSDPEKQEWASRTGTGVALTHEMRSGGADYWKTFRILYDFGYGLDGTDGKDGADGKNVKDGAETANYWDEDYPVHISGLDTSSLLLMKGGECLLLVCDWGGGGEGALEIEGFRPQSAVSLPENKTLEITDGKVKFHLRKHDYILLKLTR